LLPLYFSFTQLAGMFQRLDAALVEHVDGAKPGLRVNLCVADDVEDGPQFEVGGIANTLHVQRHAFNICKSKQKFQCLFWCRPGLPFWQPRRHCSR